MNLFFKRFSWIAGIIGFVLSAQVFHGGETEFQVLGTLVSGFLIGFFSIRFLGWCLSAFISDSDDGKLKELEKKVKIEELKKKLKDLED